MSEGRPGVFITLEGGEGTGKSTQARRLGAALEAQGHKVLLTREPGGAPGAEEIRSLLVTGEADRWTPLGETLLLCAARQEHLERTIRPALAEGRWVICDRFADSTSAYQGAAHGVPHTAIQALRILVVGATEPDLTLVLDLPAEEGLARAAKRTDGAGASSDGAETRFERLGLDFHKRLREAFLDIAEDAPERCAVVDARGDEETVAARIWTAVRARFGNRVGGAAP
jgi:dTMP kinase